MSLKYLQPSMLHIASYIKQLNHTHFKTTTLKNVKITLNIKSCSVYFIKVTFLNIHTLKLFASQPIYKIDNKSKLLL